jgi:hypothetical protein
VTIAIHVMKKARLQMITCRMGHQATETPPARLGGRPA